MVPYSRDCLMESLENGNLESNFCQQLVKLGDRTGTKHVLHADAGCRNTLMGTRPIAFPYGF
ncbi:hypothetical protein [Oscillatoria sp. CS-180]|uniref:hypothetical protein n=1 Tax=Oscillatoria sp. CS-180 TaxID=3021720 RepID=UPI00232F3350|nr:hypothetical protein [Oscillatoria sp. CS-180]